MQFDCVEEKARSYLPDSYCRVKGKFHERIAFIQALDRTNLALNFGAYSVEGSSSMSVTNKNIQSLEFLSPPLGYLEFVNKSYYVERVPKRGVYRVGICERSSTNVSPFANHSVNDIITALTKCMTKEYLPFEHARKKALGLKAKVPFSRKYAIDGSGRLFYEDDVVESDGRLLKFGNEEALEFHMHNIASLTDGYYQFTIGKKKVIDYDGDL